MEQFVVYLEEWDIVKELDGESIKELFYSLMEYVKSGEEKKLGAEISLAYGFMKAHIDRDMKKYNEVVEKRREAGRKSALARLGTVSVKKSSNKGENDGLEKWEEILRHV